MPLIDKGGAITDVSAKAHPSRSKELKHSVLCPSLPVGAVPNTFKLVKDAVVLVEGAQLAP